MQQPAPIKGIVKDVIKGLALKGGEAQELQAAWQKAAGERAAAHTRVVAVKGRKLLVNVDSSVWLHELRISRQGLIEKLRKDLGAGVVEEIRLRIGKV